MVLSGSLITMVLNNACRSVKLPSEWLFSKKLNFSQYFMRLHCTFILFFNKSHSRQLHLQNHTNRCAKYMLSTTKIYIKTFESPVNLIQCQSPLAVFLTSHKKPLFTLNSADKLSLSHFNSPP